MTPRIDTTSAAGRQLPPSGLTGAPVVVGFDEGPASVAAVRWAAVEAPRLGTALTVLSACDPPIQSPAGAGVIRPVPDLWSVSRATAARGVALARSCNDDVSVGAVGVVGGPAGELVARSSETGLVVVGRSRRGALQTAILGSVSFAVAMHARCPVVVVGEGADRHPGPSRPVVVGVDGSRPALGAVSLALAFAQASRAPLHIVGAWRAPATPGGPDTPEGGPVASVAESPWAAAARAAVADALAAATAVDPHLDMTGTVTEGRPEDVLVHEARAAGLLVVGSRGHGGFAGLMMGSVSHAAMRRAPCPVVVVRRGAV